jgi:hypothetical protein
MRPSFATNVVSGSVNVPCTVSYEDSSNKTVVSWCDDYFPLNGKQPSDLFV